MKSKSRILVGSSVWAGLGRQYGENLLTNFQCTAATANDLSGGGLRLQHALLVCLAGLEKRRMQWQLDAWMLGPPNSKSTTPVANSSSVASTLTVVAQGLWLGPV